jgi:hypothetical protein
LSNGRNRDGYFLCSQYKYVKNDNLLGIPEKVYYFDEISFASDESIERLVLFCLHKNKI